jgi:hypothetical protein
MSLPTDRQDSFLLMTRPHVQFADQMYRTGRPRLRARTCLRANPSLFEQVPDVQVIPYAGEPSGSVLEPFFDRMTQAKAANAG